MEKEILHDFIERYLNGDLSEAERQAAERRLATDAGFRAEVALQRAMQEHLGNRSEVRLRFALDEMWKGIAAEQAPSSTKTKPGFKAWGLYLAAALALVLLVVAWCWFRSSPITPEQPELEKSNLPAPIQESPQGEQKQAPSTKETEKRPIAMADPADFIPNPVLEVRIGSVRGGNDTELEMNSPQINMEFQLKHGKITLPVKGTLIADSLSALQPVRMFIYSNQPKDWESKHMLYDLSFPFKPAGKDQYRVDFRKQLQLRPGLYYAVAGQERPAETGGGYRTLWVGKFTVEVQK